MTILDFLEFAGLLIALVFLLAGVAWWASQLGFLYQMYRTGTPTKREPPTIHTALSANEQWLRDVQLYTSDASRERQRLAAIVDFPKRVQR